MSLLSKKRTSNFDVIDEILRVDWIFEKVFWKLLNYLVFDESIDDSMAILENIYWYKDIRDIFNRKVDKWDFRDLAKIIFKFQENMSNNPTE